MIATKRLSHTITQTLSENHIILQEECDIYEYCFHYIIDISLYCIIFLLIALMCHELLIGILFTLMFFLLRSNGGGVHAPTERLCTVFSFAIYIFVLWVAPKTTGYDWWLCPTLYCLSAAFICFLAPVDHANKLWYNSGS